MIKEITITNLDELTQILTEQEYRKDLDRFRCSYLYRGMPDSSYKMDTSLHRNCKHLQKTLFTIFDLNEGCPLPVEKNTFSSLVPDATLKKNIYIIGTNSDMLLFKDLSYSEYLRHLASYIKNRYPEEKVFYCPHRRDSHDYSGLVSDLGWCMFDTKFSVEIDFVQGKLYPLFIVGFGSTALLTLKKIFPDRNIPS